MSKKDKCACGCGEEIEEENLCCEDCSCDGNCQCEEDCNCENECECAENECDHECKCEENKEYLKDLLRVQAEFDNYRKRMTSALGDARQDGFMDAIEQFLPAIDSFKMATEYITDQHTLMGIKFIEKDGFSVVVDNDGQIITDMKLLAHLRGLRMKLAQKEQKAPYMIIKNKGLVSLATYRPTTKEEFINLNGLGETTYNNYGVLFVNAIKEFYNN